MHTAHPPILHGPILAYPISVAPPAKDTRDTRSNQFCPPPEVDGTGRLTALDYLDSLSLALGDNSLDVDATPPHACGPSVSVRPQLDTHEIPEDLPARELGSPSQRSLRKWVTSLHRRASRRLSIQDAPYFPESFQLGRDGSKRPARLQRRHRRISSSGSSFGFVATVRGVSLSLATASLGAFSGSSDRARILSRTERSSKASASGLRASEDSAIPERATLRQDAAATERARQRRCVLEEMIATEESYIGDIRFLINVYGSTLASLSSKVVGLRRSINRNLTDIVELHEEILGELHRVIPDSEYSQPETQLPVAPLKTQNQAKLPGHRRWRSLDTVPGYHHSTSPTYGSSGLLADPQVAADVARIFAKRMNRFFIYKEYAAKYDTLTADFGSAPSIIPDWELYQKGLEVLGSTIASVRHSADTVRKSLAVSDLIMKPIQRICKYPLLLSDLLRYTTVTDCPNSHMEVESTLTRLREAVAEINHATENAQNWAILEKTWLLQDRLVFPQRELDAVTKTRIRSLGRIHLCGALHVCWQSAKGMQGQYMVSLLYQDVLCLANAGKVDQIYTIMACVNLNKAKVEDADNGYGIQCHTAPFSWKLVFECDCEKYELLMTACSAKEEVEWRSRLSRPGQDDREPNNPNIYSTTELNMTSLGTVFGKQGSNDVVV